MTAYLGMTCLCGRSTAAPCRTISEIPSVLASFVGWSFDERGMVRCPDCLAADHVGELPKPVASVSQPDLFGDGA